MTHSDPHAASQTLTAGTPLENASAVLILIHGRGATAAGILRLVEQLQVPSIHALAPQAAGNTWYPHSFLAPLADNQPHLDSALLKIAQVIQSVETRGISPNQIALLGFSQGACLACEFIARNPRRYGAVMALTGGVIGPPGMERNDTGSLHDTPIFLGANTPDAHVPFNRVEETAEIFLRMSAAVDLRPYPGMPHAINHEQLAVCREMLTSLTSPHQDRP